MAAELLLQQISADFVLLLLRLSCVSSPFLSSIAQHLTQLSFILWLSARDFLSSSPFLFFATFFLEHAGELRIIISRRKFSLCSPVITVLLVVLSVCS
jgi:hypothetical protein